MLREGRPLRTWSTWSSGLRPAHVGLHDVSVTCHRAHPKLAVLLWSQSNPPNWDEATRMRPPMAPQPGIPGPALTSCA